MTLRVSNPVAFRVLAEEALLARSGIEARVYSGTSPATLLDVLPRARGRRWLEQLSDPGAGELEVHERDPKLVASPDLLAFGNIVRFHLDGVARFAFVIEQRRHRPASEGEDGGRWVAVSGRGVLSLLEHAVVYPAGPGLAGEDRRAFAQATPGEVLGALVAEARTRGALAAVTAEFDAEVDADGAPWPGRLSLEEGVGTDLLQVASRLAELGVDVEMTEDLRLRAHARRGIDRSAQTPDAPPVVLRVAHNVAEMEVEAEGVIKNALLVRTPSGLAERQDASSVGEFGRREGYLALENVTDEGQVTASAEAALREAASPRAAATVRVLAAPGHAPYVDFGVGDDVLAPSVDGTLAPHRVRSIAVAEDATGGPAFTVELDAVVLTLEERLARWLKRIGDGTLGGTAAALASPALDPATRSGVEASLAQGIAEHTAGEPHPAGLGDLGDVSTAGAGAGDVLAFDASSGTWSASTPRGVDRLAELADVSAPAPAEGEALCFDGTAGLWVPRALPAVPSVLDDLADVAAAGAAEADVLSFDAAAGSWEPRALPPPAAAPPAWSAFDIPPGAPNAKNEEMDGPLAAAWTWQAPSGVPGQGSLGEWVWSPPTAPRYNVGLDVPGALVIQPIGQSLLKAYRGFAPGSGTRWAVCAKVRLGNATGTDDRVTLAVERAAPRALYDEPFDGALVHLRRNVDGLEARGYRCSSGVAGTVHSLAFGTTAYLAIVGTSDNAIRLYVSSDGIGWTKLDTVTGQPICGNVAYVWIAARDGHLDTAPTFAVVEFVRFGEGSASLYALGMGR